MNHWGQIYSCTSVRTVSTYQTDEVRTSAYPDDDSLRRCQEECLDLARQRAGYNCCRINYKWEYPRCHYGIITGTTGTPGEEYYTLNLNGKYFVLLQV